MEPTFLNKDDYEEPRCPLSKPTDVTPIPTGRVIEKLDIYLNRKDYPAAERHLSYWLTEARMGNDRRGVLTILNEQIGLYRKTGKELPCLTAIKDACELLEDPEFEGMVTKGTTLVNAATGYAAFRKFREAQPLYQAARVMYEAHLDPCDGRLGGLYNNMALTETALSHYAEARELFQKALSIMAQNEHGQGEMAITYCNLADLASAELGPEKAKPFIDDCMKKAMVLIHTESLPRNGYYAFICEKCAPVFGHYGYGIIEKELMQKAREIYERS